MAQIKTIEYSWDSYKIATQTPITSGSAYSFSPTKNVYLPDKDGAFREVFMLIHFQSGASAAANVTDVTVAMNIDGTDRSPDSDPVTGQYTVNSGESVMCYIVAKFTSAFTNYWSNGVGCYLKLTVTGPDNDGITAKLYITYEFNPNASTLIKTIAVFVGARTTSLAAGGTQAFTHTVPIPEDGVTIRDKWYEVFSQTGRGDSNIQIRIGSDSDTTQAWVDGSLKDVLHHWFISEPTASWAYNTSQTLTITGNGDAHEGISAVCYVTYEYNNVNSATRQKRVKYALGSYSNAGGTSENFIGVNVYLPDLAGLDPNNIQSAYFEVMASVQSSSNVSIRARIGSNYSTAAAYAYSGGGSTSEMIEDFHFLYDVTAFLKSYWTAGALVEAGITGTASLFSWSVILHITYKYNKYAGKKLRTVEWSAGQKPAYNTGDPWTYAFTGYAPEFGKTKRNVGLIAYWIGAATASESRQTRIQDGGTWGSILSTTTGTSGKAVTNITVNRDADGKVVADLSDLTYTFEYDFGTTAAACCGILFWTYESGDTILLTYNIDTVLKKFGATSEYQIDVKLLKILTSDYLIDVLFKKLNMQAQTGMERVVNGGFETGDFTGWTNDTWSIQSSGARSGTYCAFSYSVQGNLEQEFTPVIAVSNIAIFGFWWKVGGGIGNPEDQNITVRITYSDDSYDDLVFDGSSDWIYVDLVPYLQSGKSVKKVKFTYQNSNWWARLDDVSLILCGYLLDVVLKKLNQTLGYLIDTLFKKTDITSDYLIDVQLATAAQTETLPYLIDVLFKEGKLAPYTLDVLFKKLGISSAYSTDVLLKRLNDVTPYSIDVAFSKIDETKPYLFDVLFKKLDEIDAYFIDVAFKALNQPTPYDIDVLFKKLGIPVEYLIDVQIAGADFKNYFIDVLFKKQNEIKTYLMDVLLSKRDQSIPYLVDTIFAYLNQTAPYLIDVLFKKFDAFSSYLTDVLLQKRNETLGYLADVLFKDTDEYSDYSIDVLFEKAGIDKEYLIDALFKALDAIKNYSIDVIIVKRIIINYLMDILLENPNVTALYLIDTLFKLRDSTESYSIDVILSRVPTIPYLMDTVMKLKNTTSGYGIDVFIYVLFSFAWVLDKSLIENQVVALPEWLNEERVIDYNVWSKKRDIIELTARLTNAEVWKLEGLWHELFKIGFANEVHTVWMLSAEYEWRGDENSERPWVGRFEFIPV